MPTLHTIYRCGQVSHVAIPKVYNVAGLAAVDNGMRKKVYSLNSKAKRTIQSSLCKQWHERKSNITFLTFTFKNDQATAAVVCSQKLMNKYFSSLIENFKKTYGLHSYVWVSERTKIGTIHYHVVCDFPKLKKKDFEIFCTYCRNSFKCFLMDNQITVKDNEKYSNVGLPSEYDSNGCYRGAVVRNLEAVLVYVSGYLQKSDREEEEGRIYAISRNVLEKPVRTFTMGYNEITQHIKQTYVHEFCSVDYYHNTRTFEDYFLRRKGEVQIVVDSDHNRKMETKRIYNTEKRNHLFKNAIINSKQQSIIDVWDWSALYEQSVYNDVTYCELKGSIPHAATNQKLADFLAFCDKNRFNN
jgi:hypothetical protein